MSSKTLARAGASLINRLTISNSAINPLKPNKPNLLPLISPASRFDSLSAKLKNPHSSPLPITGDGYAGILKTFASPDGLSFPCGLPSLRFFIDGDDALPNEPLALLPKRTYQPSTIKRKRTHGYLARRSEGHCSEDSKRQKENCSLMSSLRIRV